jgi:hypothetical protein
MAPKMHWQSSRSLLNLFFAPRAIIFDFRIFLREQGWRMLDKIIPGTPRSGVKSQKTQAFKVGPLNKVKGSKGQSSAMDRGVSMDQIFGQLDS